MAEKYNLPGPGTRPLFFRLPRGRGVAGIGVPRRDTPPSLPPSLLAMPAALCP